MQYELGRKAGQPLGEKLHLAEGQEIQSETDMLAGHVGWCSYRRLPEGLKKTVSV